MPFFLLIFGFVLVDSGVRGNASAVYDQLKTDISGFFAFGVVILILGAAGAVESIRPIVKGLLVLVFLAFFLRNKGEGGKQIVAGVQDAVKANVNTSNASTSNTVNPVSSLTSNIGDVASYAEIAAQFLA